MLGVKLVCVGKMKEKHFVAAFAEYARRLGAYCKFELAETDEERLPDSPSQGDIDAALEREADAIEKLVPRGAYVIALCVEGERRTSEQLAGLMVSAATSGFSKLCFVVGGSFGLSERVKSAARLRLSMSDMTFPHHLARVMLAEQIYRAFMINAGTRYHK